MKMTKMSFSQSAYNKYVGEYWLLNDCDLRLAYFITVFLCGDRWHDVCN